jgi:glucoamylase
MPDQSLGDAPGAPGIPPTWTSSAKDMVGCALGESRLWFTVGFGIINEVYYPRVDIPQIRDLGFIVADGAGFWVEVKRVENYTIACIAPGVPALEVVHRHERYSLRLRIAADSRRDVLGIECELEGDKDLKLYVLLAPHLGATGYDNCATVLDYRGRRLLCAEQGPFAVALGAADKNQRDAFLRLGAGYVGVNDGWQDFALHGSMTWEYRTAGPGNVALMGELPRYAVLALGFAASAGSAATLAVSSLLQPFDNLLQQQFAQWEAWHARRSEGSPIFFDVPAALREQFLASTIVLRAHLDKTYPGAMVASLSVPWGNTANQRGGYHLVWPRDLFQCAGGFLALGAEREARDSLRYLMATQAEDGHWHQCQWIGGKPYWYGIQLDEVAVPVLLAAALDERNALDGIVVGDMVRRALAYIASMGPSTEQDRWEENRGINPFSLAVCVAALVAGAEFLDPPAKDWALRLADFWNASAERWLSASDTELAQRLGVKAHYVRVAPDRVLEDRRALGDYLPIRNRRGAVQLRAQDEIGTEFLQLVRLGLRSADDPIIRDSARVVDAILKVETPRGPAWRRYNGDGYGEHDDGRPYDGTGRGRGWPLLTGERGHYELESGKDPLPYLMAMAAMASPCGMIPEQVWDKPPIAQRRLLPGRPTGSAMPLAWAHAEFIKLLVSRHLGHSFDRLRAVWQRYRGIRPSYTHAFWGLQAPISDFRIGTRLVIALPRPAIVHWGRNGWNDVMDQPTVDGGLGFHAACLEVDRLSAGERVDFTWIWVDSGQWQGRDYGVSASAD